MDYIKLFLENITELNEKEEKSSTLVGSFTSKFPREDILNVPLEDYMFAPKGYGYETSMCSLLRYHNGIASMGNSYPDVFGIYLKGGKEITLSTTFKKKYDKDTRAAFKDIKQEIVNVLDAADAFDFDAISDCKLNRAFKYILISMYCPDKYLPVISTETLDGYCKAVNIFADPSLEMAYRNRLIVEWKEQTPEIAEWSNHKLMEFCDWMWRRGAHL